MCCIDLVQKNGRPSMCGMVNKKKDHSETQQRRRIEKNKDVNDIRRRESKIHGLCPPKRLRIKPDPEEDVNPEVLNVTQES